MRAGPYAAVEAPADDTLSPKSEPTAGLSSSSSADESSSPEPSTAVLNEMPKIAPRPPPPRFVALFFFCPSLVLSKSSTTCSSVRTLLSKAFALGFFPNWSPGAPKSKSSSESLSAMRRPGMISLHTGERERSDLDPQKRRRLLQEFLWPVNILPPMARPSRCF